jgi:hypothetical protein
MELIRVLVFVVGLVIVVETLFSAIETFVLPRSAQDNLTRLVFLVVRAFFKFPLHRAKDYEGRDRVMSFYAPIALLVLLPTWYTLAVIGYGFMFWGVGVPSLPEALRVSGSSLLTLGFSQAQGFAQTVLAFSEAAIGLILVSLLIAYLPTMYAAFSRREAAVTMLEVRAGNPPSAVELLLRYHRIHGFERMRDLWVTWEAWFADVEESHSTLPPLVFFRSQQSSRSWITAAGTILDAASLTLAVVDTPYEPQAALTIRAGYITLRRIADFFGISYNLNPQRGDPTSITRQEFDEVCETLAKNGVPLKKDSEEAWLDFSGWRVNYDIPLIALAGITMAPYAHWSSDRAMQVELPPIEGLKRPKESS